MADKPLIPGSGGKSPDTFPRLRVSDRMRGYLPSGEQFINFLKNLLWVAPLTLFIWIYAEREGAVTVPNLIFPIEVHTSDDRIVKLRGPQDRNVVVELSGPRVKVDHVQELLRARPEGNTGIQIFVDPKIGTGVQELPTVEQLNNLAVFRNNGITVKNAQPPYLVVDIDNYETRDLPVKAPPEIAPLLGDQTHFVPDTVQVRAPAHDFEKAEASKHLFVYADLAKRDEIKTKTGAYSLDNVPVFFPEFRPDGTLLGRQENATALPRTITAKLDIRQRDVTYEIPTVPIYKETPFDFEKRFYVQFPATIANVGVMGPPEQIEAIRKGDFKVRARLELTTLDNKLDTNERRALQWDLPPGVTLTKESKEHATVDFMLKDISSAR